MDDRNYATYVSCADARYFKDKAMKWKEGKLYDVAGNGGYIHHYD